LRQHAYCAQLCLRGKEVQAAQPGRAVRLRRRLYPVRCGDPRSARRSQAFLIVIAILLMTLAQFIAHTRTELAKGGLERVEFEGNVYWCGAPPSRRLDGRHPAAPARRRDGAGPAGEDAGAPILVLLHGATDQAGTWL